MVQGRNAVIQAIWHAPQKLIQSLNMKRKRHTPEEIIKKLREVPLPRFGGLCGSESVR